MTKQTLTIQDKSARVDLVLWNQQCLHSRIKIGDQVIISKAKIKRWGGRTYLEIRGGFMKFSTKIESSDEKTNTSDSTNNAKNISDETQLAIDFDWNKLESLTIQQMLTKVQDLTQQEKLNFKIIAQIKEIDGNKMWYTDKKTSMKKWRLQFKFGDEMSTFNGIAFDAAKILINGLSAETAHDMQQNDTTRFGKMMEQIIEDSQKFQLHVKAEQHDYEGNVSSRFIIVNAKKIL